MTSSNAMQSIQPTAGSETRGIQEERSFPSLESVAVELARQKHVETTPGIAQCITEARLPLEFLLSVPVGWGVVAGCTDVALLTAGMSEADASRFRKSGAKEIFHGIVCGLAQRVLSIFSGGQLNVDPEVFSRRRDRATTSKVTARMPCYLEKQSQKRPELSEGFTDFISKKKRALHSKYGSIDLYKKAIELVKKQKYNDAWDALLGLCLKPEVNQSDLARELAFLAKKISKSKDKERKFGEEFFLHNYKVGATKEEAIRLFSYIQGKSLSRPIKKFQKSIPGAN
jgi:hypothetical protein